MTRETRERLLTLQAAIEDADSRVKSNESTRYDNESYVCEQKKKIAAWWDEVQALGGRLNLYLVHVSSTLENGFEAGCHVCIEAQSEGEAETIAYNQESEAVGSDHNDQRTTTSGPAVKVPSGCESFIREVFSVTTG